MAPSDPLLERRRVASPPPTDPQTRAEALSVAARALRAAEHVCVLAGAGVSAESGIPAHQALVTLASRVAHCTLVTQNVDDLHERAGSRDVISLHGSLMRARCSAGCPGTMVPTEAQAAEPPTCPTCGALMRPDVVWFGEPMPMAEFEAARSAAVACDVFLSVGTSNVVEPAASLPWISATHGATVIVVNPSMDGQRRGPSILPIEGPAGVMLPRLIAEAFAGRRARRHEAVAPPSRDSTAPSSTAAQLPLDATSASSPTSDQPSE